jgi:hypothetical protein
LRVFEKLDVHVGFEALLEIAGNQSNPEWCNIGRDALARMGKVRQIYRMS